jgi:CHAD domain-containing protein
METAFILKASEIDPAFFKALNLLFGNDRKLEVIIRPSEKALPDKTETKEEYFARLKESAEEAKKGNVVRFTGKEFKAFTKKLSAR